MKSFPVFLVQIIFFSQVRSLPSGQTAIIAPFSDAAEVSKHKIEQKFQSKIITFSPPFPDSGRQHAVLEAETGISKIDTLYGRLQEFVAGYAHPKPIVDTIEEHEKYGNDGDPHRSVGVKIIAGVEGASNLLNAAVDAPFEVIRQAGKKVSNSLNTLGGKLVGLEY